MNLLIAVDMQNDFIDGALGTKEAEGIVSKVVDYIKSFDGKVIYTRDTHPDNYLQTLEGDHLPVEHCIKGTDGWQIREEIAKLIKDDNDIIDKPSFGSMELAKRLQDMDKEEKIDSITLIGICTDICVISNALIAKAALPEVEVKVKSELCAGVSPKSHNNALDAMKVCHIVVE